MKHVLLIVSVCVLALTGVLHAAETLNPVVTVLVDSADDNPSGDLGVQGTYGTGNFDAGSVQQSYMMFDLSGLGNVQITEARFSITGTGSTPYLRNSQNPLAFLNHVDADITGGFDWVTQPDDKIGDDFGDSVNLTDPGLVSWDLIATGWDWQYDLDNGFVTFLVAPEYPNFNNSARFVDPTLTLAYSVVPAPGSITLAVLGISSVMAVRRRKRAQ